MAKSTNLNFTQDVNVQAINIENANGTNNVDLMVGDADDSIINSIVVTSTDTVSRVLNMAMLIGSQQFDIASLTIPAGAGTDGATPGVSFLNATDCPWTKIDSNGNRTLSINSAVTLTFFLSVAVAVDKRITVVALAENF